jgi:hypothetical protein
MVVVLWLCVRVTIVLHFDKKDGFLLYSNC